jgi:hypothetical protein
MDPVQASALDDLIDRVDEEGTADAASPAETEPTESQEIAEPDGQPEGDAGDVNEDDEGEESDDEEPDEDGAYEVNPADLTPAQPQAAPDATLAEMAALRQQVNELQGFQTQQQQIAEQAEFRAFLESLKGMDPDEQKDAVATRIAHSYIALQQQVADRAARDQQQAAESFEAQQREKAIAFLAQGGRRVEGPHGARYVANPRLALTERETERLRRAALGGMTPLALEQMAQDFVDDRKAQQGEKRSQKQKADAKSGASRTLAGAGAAKPQAKTYGSGEEALDSFLDDLLG